MSEERYCYKKIILPNGSFGYERVPFNPNDEFLEPPAIVPRLSPPIKNGEVPGSGSVVVERLIQKTLEGRRRIEAREEVEKMMQETFQKVVDKHRKALEQACAPEGGSGQKEAPAPTGGPRRVIEP